LHSGNKVLWKFSIIYLSGILGGKGCLFSDDVSNGSETHYYKYVLSELTENGKSHMKERQHPKKEHWRYACVKVILKRDISKVACNVSKWVVCPSIYEFCLHLWYLQTFLRLIQRKLLGINLFNNRKKIRIFPHFPFFHSKLTLGFWRLTWRVPLVGQELVTLQEHPSSLPVIVGFMLLN
jgi:hypothetical protein